LLFGGLSRFNIDMQENPISPEQFISLLKAIEDKEITASVGKNILMEMLENPSKKSATEIAREHGLSVISDLNFIENLCKELVEEYPLQVKKYQDGQTGVMAFFMGHAMRKIRFRLPPQEVQNVLESLLKRR